jgi:prepilin-type N-terminal cleavage/methylation domain-containing protein
LTLASILLGFFCGCNRQSSEQILLNQPVALFTPAKQKNKPMKTTKHRLQAGFTLVEIMIVVAIIGLLAAIAIPNFVKARATSQCNACINNLRQMDAAADQYALENHMKTGDTFGYLEIMPYIKLNSSNQLPACPAGGTYDIMVHPDIVGSNVLCSLSTLTPAHALQ